MDKQLDIEEIARRKIFTNARTMIVHYYYIREWSISAMSEFLDIPTYVLKEYMAKNDLPFRRKEKKS